jgi:hypothetical protein
MSDLDALLRGSIIERGPKVSKGKCKNCRGPLEVAEIDFRRGVQVLRCQRCGLLHYFTRNIIGWKLWRVTQADLTR